VVLRLPGDCSLVRLLDDVADVIRHPVRAKFISLIMSTTGAILVTLIFLDLHLRWPPGGRLRRYGYGPCS